MRIIFMGTPDFAVGALESLINAGHEIVGVFTQPDKPQGRKMILTAPPVKVCAEKHGLKVFQPKSVRTEESLELIRGLNPELIAVVAYGKILPKALLDIPKFGCVNAHASLLPKYRGASPIQWSIVSGDTETGVTTMLMDEGMDTGDMLLVGKTEITSTETFESLHDKLAVIGADLLTKTVERLEKGEITPKKQPEDGVTYAPIITKEMGLIDFTKTAAETDCLVRGFTPWPSAYFFLGEQRVKIIKSAIGKSTDKEPGTVISVGNALTVACKNGTSLEIFELQPEGKPKMTAKAMLNGHPVKVGEKLC